MGFDLRFLVTPVGAIGAVCYLLIDWGHPLPPGIDVFFFAQLMLCTSLGISMIVSHLLFFSSSYRSSEQWKTDYDPLYPTVCAAALACLAGLLIDVEPFQSWHNIFFSVWMLFTLNLYYRVLKLLYIMQKDLEQR